MAEFAIKKNPDVGLFLDGFEKQENPRNYRAVVELKADVTRDAPALLADAIIGFARCRYRCRTGSRCDCVATASAAAQEEPDPRIVPASHGEALPLHQEA